MLAPLVLLLAAAAPRAVPDADVVIHLERPAQISRLTAFFDRAGKHSAMLSPAAWAPELLPVLGADVRDAKSLTEAGISPARPFTTSLVGDGRVTCFGLADPALFRRQARQRLGAIGELWEGKPPSLFGAALDGVQIAGVAVHRKEACVAEDRDGVAPLLEVALRTLRTRAQRVKALDGLGGEAQLLVPGRAALGLSGGADALEVNGVTLSRRSLRLRGAGLSPYGAMRSSGMMLARARLAQEAVPALTRRLESQLAAACPSCDRAALGRLVFALGETLTGEVAVRVDRAEVTGTLRTPAARFFALKQAVVAQVSDVAKAKAQLEAAARLPGARPTTRGVALPMSGGEVELGLSGAHLFIGNDEQAITNLVQEIPPKPAAMAHGAEVWVDPKLVHRAFGQVSLLDLMSSRELAAVVAVGTEVGPLLGKTRALSGWVDPAPGGRLRFWTRWELDAP